MPPFPGYSWSFTQHGVGFRPENLFGLLKTAVSFAGFQPRREVINRFLAEAGILTRNIREERGPDAWRDYQQILPELGLIYSTDLVPAIRPTPIGLALLDGLLGYSEVLTTQALRYQYPNGFKDDVSNRQRVALHGTALAGAASLIDLQMRTGVLVKPGVILLQSLLNLREVGERHAFLTTSEIQQHLVPIYHYQQELPPAERIIAQRRRRAELPRFGRRRNIQDWMRFLGQTDLFVIANQELRLSEVATQNIGRVRSLLAYHQAPDSYWVPRDANEGTRVTWFAHFGSLSLRSQWALLERQISKDYEKKNYVAGRDDIDEVTASEPEGLRVRLEGIGADLREVQVNGELPRAGEAVPVLPTLEELQRRYRQAEKQRSFHARMVAELATMFRARGAQVTEDPNSVDLLVSAAGIEESILEVKTVTTRNLIYRVRLGVGQLYEYQFRREREVGSRASLALVLSSDIPAENELVRFLNGHLGMGLVSRTDAGGYRGHAPRPGTALDLLGPP